MSLVGPTAAPESIPQRLVLIGYGELAEDRALAGVLVDTLVDKLGLWCYVFEADEVQAWQEAGDIAEDAAKFDLASIIMLGSFQTLGQWLQGSAKRFFGTSIVNVGSEVGPPLALTTANRNDVLSVYRQDQLHELVPWANALGSRHTAKVVMGALESFAGYYRPVAKRIAQFLDPDQERARFHKATKYVAKVSRSKQIAGVKVTRDAAYDPVLPGLFYRSADLVGITDKGKDQLRALGVELIVDMRPEKYRKQRAIVVEGIAVATFDTPSRAILPVVLAVRNKQPVLVFGMKATDADVQFICSTALRKLGVPPATIEHDARL